MKPLSIFLVLISPSLLAQIGIKSTAPDAMLDITASNAGESCKYRWHSRPEDKLIPATNPTMAKME